MADKHSYQRFHLNQVAQSFPDTAETMLLDTYLTDKRRRARECFGFIGIRRRTIMRAPTNIFTFCREEGRSG